MLKKGFYLFVEVSKITCAQIIGLIKMIKNKDKNKTKAKIN